MKNAKKPHVHAELIKAWADGATIEYNNEFASSEWREVVKPAWHSHIRYRVKPEPVIVVKYHGITQSTTEGWSNCNHTTGYHGSFQAVRSTDSKEWKLIAIVKTTFADNVPIAVELVK